jgi:hypothetical protein
MAKQIPKKLNAKPFFVFYKSVYEFEVQHPDTKFAGTKVLQNFGKVTLEKQMSTAEVELGLRQAEAVINKRHGVTGNPLNASTAKKK